MALHDNNKSGEVDIVTSMTLFSSLLFMATNHRDISTPGHFDDFTLYIFNGIEG